VTHRRQQIATFAQHITADVRTRLRRNFLLRWVVANAIGWSIGLYLSTPALCLGGVFAGLCVGAAQWWALKNSTPFSPEFKGEGEQNAGESPVTVGRDWIGLTAAGAFLGALPAMSATLMVALGWGLGIALLGAVFGAGVGIAQWFILQRGMSRAGWWIAANIGGGALCALFTLAPLIRGLPIGLLIGTILYGYLTGRALMWMQRQSLKPDAGDILPD
jgi:hypothetical protein